MRGQLSGIEVLQPKGEVGGEGVCFAVDGMTIPLLRDETSLRGGLLFLNECLGDIFREVEYGSRSW